MISSMLSSLHSTVGYPRQTSRLWTLVEGAGFFWDGNPVGKNCAHMWVRGWWSKPKTMRYTVAGCLTCNCRTARIHPGVSPSLAVAALQSLFGE